MRATAVIGAGWGDEGKGLMTDYLCDQAIKAGEKPLVIRHNGGSQAGHTVVTPEGRHSVFSHFGSGSFLSVPTFLSRFFICNPLLWHRERDKMIGRLETDPNAQPSENFPHAKLIVDPRAMLTTPYDMLINEEIERQRGNARHGSCGAGINETMRRHYYETYATTVDLAAKPIRLLSKLYEVRDKWVPRRLADLKIDKPSEEFLHLVESRRLMTTWLDFSVEFYESCLLSRNPTNEYDHLIFEGAQGLHLDQDRKDMFPHVTPSSTGIRNALMMLDEMDLEQKLAAVYVTRPYSTRHGAGPLPHEYPPNTLMYKDTTNREGEWQGKLRFAPLDVTALHQAIGNDLAIGTNDGADVTYSIALTHMDQMPEKIHFYRRGIEFHSDHALFMSCLFDQLGPEDTVYVSRGPTRNDVTRSNVLQLVGEADLAARSA